MGVTFPWSGHPPKQALPAMVSLPKRLQAWFISESEKRAHARKVAKEGLTRGGFFLMGLLLAWLWMMLIGQSVTNRCWLPGPLLQLRHRDGSHKVIDVRLSGRYNGSRLVPLNTTLEAERKTRPSKPAYESGYLSKKQRELHGATTARDGSSRGVGARGKEPPGSSGSRVVINEDGDFSKVGGSARVAGARTVERLSASVRKGDTDRTAEEVLGLHRTASERSENSSTVEGTTDGSEEVERLSAGHRTVEQRPDGQRTVEIRSKDHTILEDSASRQVSGVEGEKRLNGEALERSAVEGRSSSQALGNRPARLAVNRTLEPSAPGSRSSSQVEEDGNGYKTPTETVVSHPGSGLQLGAGSKFQAKNVDKKTYGVREVVALGKDGNPLIMVTRPHPKTRLRNLVFGIAATAATWSERKEILRLWWDPNRLRGYVWMDTPDLSSNNCSKGAVTARDPMAKASVLWEAHVSGALRALTNRTCGTGKKIDYSWMDKADPGLPPVVYSANFSQYAYTHPTGLRSAIRVARVAVEMYRENHEPDVLWYVMGDDDTIFCPPNLASVLSKYDPRQLVYIGAPSESHLQNVEFSNEMGYGGGGFALSVTLAKRLSEIFDTCLHRYPEVYGSDARVQACLAELGVHMRKERGFHQFDLLGNMAGALEGHPIAPFLSMHHVAVFQPVFPQKSAMAGLVQLTRTMKRHPREFLQQTMCLNQAQKFSISIAWGYSVRWYPEYIRPTDLERPQRTFRAWNRGREPFDFDMDTRSTPVTICRVPSLFHASGASSRLEGGRVILETRYTRTVTDWAEEGSSKYGNSKLRTVSKACPEGEVHIPQREVTEIRVVAPPFSDGWVLAPRRQCCQSVEVIDEKTVQIKLDVCGEGQLIG